MPNEPFWTQLQSFYDRIPTIEQRRREARQQPRRLRHHLNQQLHGILQTLNLRALAQRCSASVPPRPVTAPNTLTRIQRWQPFAGGYVRVLRPRRPADGRRRLAFAGSEHWNEAKLSGTSTKPGFVVLFPVVLLELVSESPVDRRTGQGNDAYLLYLHATASESPATMPCSNVADDLPACAGCPSCATASPFLSPAGGSRCWCHRYPPCHAGRRVGGTSHYHQQKEALLAFGASLPAERTRRPTQRAPVGTHWRRQEPDRTAALYQYRRLVDRS